MEGAALVATVAAAAAAAAAAAGAAREGEDNPLLERLPPLTRADCAYARCYCEVRAWMGWDGVGWDGGGSGDRSIELIGRSVGSSIVSVCGLETELTIGTATPTQLTPTLFSINQQENTFHLCARLAAALHSDETDPRALSELIGGPPPTSPQVRGASAGRVSALFISNARRCVPVWRQRQHQEEGREEDEPVLWDYHGACAGLGGVDGLYCLATPLPDSPPQVPMKLTPRARCVHARTHTQSSASSSPPWAAAP